MGGDFPGIQIKNNAELRYFAVPFLPCSSLKIGVFAVEMAKESINITCFSIGNNLLAVERADVCVECLFDFTAAHTPSTAQA